jgi:hypothetical protein
MANAKEHGQQDVGEILRIGWPEGAIPCRPCNATGRLFTLPSGLFSEPQGTFRGPCPQCDGKGYIAEG